MLGQFYQWLWFHTEFWLTPVDRRPFTFIWRDWIYTHVPLAVTLIVFWFAGLVVLHFFHALTAFILGIISAFVLAHLVWGEKWIFGKQEDPQYLGD